MPAPGFFVGVPEFAVILFVGVVLIAIPAGIAWVLYRRTGRR